MGITYLERCIASNIENRTFRKYAVDELSADDIAVDTEAQAVCDEVKLLRKMKEGSHISETKYVPFTPKGAYFCDSFGFKQIDFDCMRAEGMSGLRCVAILPNKPAFETYIHDGLKCMQRAVSDHSEEALIEFTYPFEDNAILLGNEDAKLNGMEGNRRLNGSIYAGPIYVVGDDGEGGLCSLTDEQVQKYSEMFAEPEDISQEEVQSDVGFTFYRW